MKFDLKEARRLRDEGIETVAENNADFLAVARSIAKRLARGRIGKSITCDDVRKRCPITPNHPNAWGAVFKEKTVWLFTGDYQQSAIVSRHGGMQRIWRLL